MAFLAPLFFARPRRARRSPSDPPDSARTEERRSVSVADVRAADSVSVGAAAAHSQLGAAAAAAGGAGADRRGVRASVPAQHEPGGRRRRRARRVVLLDRSYSMGYGDRGIAPSRRRATRWPGWRPAIAASLVLFASSAEIALRRPTTRHGCDREVDAATPSAGATRYGPALKLAGSLLARSTAAAARGDPHQRLSAQRLAPGEGLRLPTGTALTPVSVQARQPSEPRGDAGDDCSARRASGQDRVTVTAGVPTAAPRPVDRSADHARARRPRRADRSSVNVQRERLGVHRLPAVRR